MDRAKRCECGCVYSADAGACPKCRDRKLDARDRERVKRMRAEAESVPIYGAARNAKAKAREKARRSFAR